jgi:hypothetical protein
MDFWNRVITSLVAVLVVVAAIVTLLVAAEAVSPDFLPGGSAGQPSDAWFHPQLKGVADFSGDAQVITMVVLIVVAVAMVGLLLLEFRRLRRREAMLLISSTPDGALSIEVSSVRLLAERTGIANRNISSLRCRLRMRKRPPPGGPASIIIVCYPRVILGTNVQEVRDDLQTRIKDTVQGLTGLNVLQINVVRVRYDRSDDSRLIGS